MLAAPSTAGAVDPRTQHPVHDAIDLVSRSPRRETDGEADVGGSQDLRRRATASQDDEDDEGRPVDMPGLRQASRRTGARIGSVAWNRKPEIRLRPCGSTQDMIIRPNTSAHRAMNRNCRKLETKAPPTSPSLPAVVSRPATARRPQWAWSIVAVVMVMRSLAEQRPTDPDDRGALLDGELEVVGHAHRQLGAQAGRAGGGSWHAVALTASAGHGTWPASPPRPTRTARRS